jgi:hypothetical protein
MKKPDNTNGRDLLLNDKPCWELNRAFLQARATLQGHDKSRKEAEERAHL